jgi:hypothetical protein
VPGPYFHKTGWSSFDFQGTTYTLDHLKEYEFSVTDSAGQHRTIAVTFRDHCFTRVQEHGDDKALIYPGSDRGPGVFCFTRYSLSLDLASHIERAAAGKVWNLASENFAAVPAVDKAGQPVLYGIIFSLDGVSGLPVDLHMRVETAYPIDEKDLATFGHVRFPHLVALRMAGKKPKHINDYRRQKPRNPPARNLGGPQELAKETKKE